MYVAFDNIIMHQTIDNISAFALCGAEYKGMPEQVPLINEGIGAHEILEGVIGIERIGADFKFLPVAEV